MTKTRKNKSDNAGFLPRSRFKTLKECKRQLSRALCGFACSASDLLLGSGGRRWLVSYDVVEVCPAHDGPGQITALLGATVMAELLALAASNQG
ncbi:arginase family protein [Acidocella sp.]|uniref:arginase family protein n=1 Tax=Acidocella sp. TaxID=50710 RepID=UPI003D06DC67